MSQLMIDWEGLARSFQSKDPVPGDPSSYMMNTYTDYESDTSHVKDGLQYDVAGLWNSFEFDEDKWKSFWHEKSLPVRVGKDANGFNVFDFVLNDVPDFIGDALIDTWQFQVNPLRALNRKLYEKIQTNPEYARVYAQKMKEALPKLQNEVDPSIMEEIGMGVEEGIVQNVNLLLGSEAKSYDATRLAATDEAIAEGYRAGIITKDEYDTYQQWRKDRQMNTSLAFDISAGLTNSILIMSELVATGGLASIDMAGIRFFSAQGLKLYGKGILTQGVNTWKLMGAGANIRAMGDAIDTAREENLDAGEFIVELAGNAFRENLSAFAEGASEGVLLNLKLGSVPLAKWMGQPVKVGGREITKYMNARELKALMKAAKEPRVIKAAEDALNVLRKNRKEIVKQIQKNTGKKMLNGLLLETSTEQLTDLLQDAFEKDSHASILNLFSDDPEHRDEAFRNLIVEAAVGLVLGFGMGLGDIWSRKPMQELRDKYGDAIANQIDKTIQDPNVKDKVAAVLVDNGKSSEDPDVRNTESTANAMQNSGSQDTTEEVTGPTDIEDLDEFLTAAKISLYSYDFRSEDPTQNMQVIADPLEKKRRHMQIEKIMKKAKTLDDVADGLINAGITFQTNERQIFNTWAKKRLGLFNKEDAKAKQQARQQLPADMVQTIAEVDGIPDANILDFTMLLGQKQLQQEHQNLVNQIEDIKLTATPSNFLLTATPKVMHTMTQAAYNNVASFAADQGVMEKLVFVPEGQVELKRDVAVGIALSFDELGWGYVRHKYSGNNDIDFIIGEAQKLAKSNHQFGPKGKKMTRKNMQATARKKFTQGFEASKAAALNSFSTTVIEGEVGYDPWDVPVNEGEGRNITNVEITGGDVGFVDQDDDIGSSVDKPEDRWETIERPPFKAVALRTQDGQIIQGDIGMQHMDIAYGSRAKVNPAVSARGEFGFVNWDGEFVTRDEMRARYGVGESHEAAKAGLIAKIGQRYETIPDASYKFPTYDSVLPNVEEITFLDLAKHFEEKGIINETTKEVFDKILPVIGNRKIKLLDMGPEHAGGTDIYTLETHINTKAPMLKSTSPFDTMVHEGLHSWLMIFMDQNTDLAEKFRGQIRGVLNAVRSVLNAPEDSQLLKERWLGTVEELKSFRKIHNKILHKATKNEEEFLTSVFSDTQSIKWITDRVMIGGPVRKLTGWKKIWNSIKGVLKKEATVTPTATQKLKESLEDFTKIITAMNLGLNQEFNVALVRENKRLSSQVTSMYQQWETWDDDLEDSLDDYQTLDDIANEDESKVENQTVNNFIADLAEAMGISEGEYRDSVREKTFDTFRDDMQKFDAANSKVITRRLERMYNGYKHIWPTFAEFRSQFLKRQYLNIVNKEAKVSAIVVASNDWDPERGEAVRRYQIRLAKGSYVDGKGTRRNTYKETIALEEFIPKFTELLGLPKDTFQVVFLDGFETWKDGKIFRRNSFDRLRKEFFFDYGDMNDGPEIPITGHLADWIYSSSANTGSSYDMLYLGNFAKKNTLPVLAFRATDKKKVREALERFEVVFANAAAEHFGESFTAEREESRRMAQTARALLESMWFNKEFVRDDAGNYVIQDPSVVREDWNKIMKRATKWLVKQNKVAFTEREIERKFKNRDLSGTKLLKNDAQLRAAVVNSKDDRPVTFKIMGHTFSIPANELLMNELGTAIGDGASVYIIGQFDDLYLTANGALKSGIIKNVYGSVVDENPIFIKHAMHGVSADSLLGRWMIENDLSMLVFDEAMKEGKDHYVPIGLADLADKAAMASVTNLAESKGQEVIVNLQLSRFQRIKEIENRDTLGGSTKQLINGTALSDLYNVALKEAVKKSGVKGSLNDILVAFSNAQTQQAVKWFQKNTTPAATLDLLREIIANPKSPLERSVSNIWGTLLAPKEGQTDEDVLRKYGGAFDHAHTAEAIRNRLQHRMAQLLGGKTAGQRGGLSFNGGYLNHKRDVEPITTNYNLASILISEFDAVPREVMEAAIPESGALTIVRKLQDVGRAESRAHRKLSGHELKRRLDTLHQYRVKLIKQLRALDSARINNIVSEGSTKVSIHRLINWDHPTVQRWKNEVVFGKEVEDNGVKVRDKSGILNIGNGRLREGWGIIPEDVADNFGIKPGDWVLDIVTPSDSPMGFAAYRVAAISKVNEDGSGRKVSDRNAIVLNSEWTQTKNGKDFDADDISIVPFDPDFWRLDQYMDLVKIAREIPAIYTKYIKDETIKLLKKNKTAIKTEDGRTITAEDLQDPEQTDRLIFGEPMVKEKFSILLNGAPKGGAQRRVFPLMGSSFMELDSLYLFSPAPIINERLYHSASSAINMRAKKVPLVLQNEDGKLSTKGTLYGEPIDMEADFIVRNPDWMRNNVNHLNRTHADVDFPNKTTRLAYDNDPLKLSEQFWGLDNDKLVSEMNAHLKRPLFQAIKNFQRLLFEDAFNLARARDTDLYESLGYYETLAQLVRAKNRLQALATNNKEALKQIYGEFAEKQKLDLGKKYRVGTSEHTRGLIGIKQGLKFIEGFIDNMQVDNVYDYPLFNTIKNINLNDIPEPGNTYKDHLINQVLATGESISMWPEVQERYKKAVTAPKSFFIVGFSAAEKKARTIMKLLGRDPAKNSRAVVAGLIKNPDRLERWKKAARPGNIVEVDKLLREFADLNEKVGQPYESFQRGALKVNVDNEVIAFSRIPRQFDFFAGRAERGRTKVIVNEKGETVRRPLNNDEYWDEQLRMAREEAVTIMHAFDIEPIAQNEEEIRRLPDATIERRTAHQRVYPLLWKNILESPYLYFNSNETVELKTEDGNSILVKNDGRGALSITRDGVTTKHTDLTSDSEIYKLFTERNGLWEGIEETSHGTANRAAMTKILRMARNLSMERRFEMLKDFIAQRIYGSQQSFTTNDQVAFWMSLTAQTSNQALQDNKAKGFIVNQSAWDPNRPYKYQNNHLVLDLMSIFEESLVDAWMQLYSHANAQKERMVYEDQPHMSPQEGIRTFYSGLIDQIEETSKDSTFVNFYRSMRGKDWKEGLEGLRKLLKNFVLLRSLSENGIFYEDIAKDIMQLTDQQFFDKYKGVDVEDINLTIERYMGKNTVEQFLRQHAGEDTVAFRTRGTIISLYWALNGARKKEAKKEKKLGKISRYLSSFVGYDLTALLGEKKTYTLAARDEEIGFFFDPVTGVAPVTTHDVQIASKPFATRTWLPVGESSLAQAKTQRSNRTLNQYQIDLNDQIRLVEDIIKLAADPNYRGQFREQFSHRTKFGRKQAPQQYTDRTRLISRLLEQIPESERKQLEISRKEIFELAENLKKRGKIWIEIVGGVPTYNIELNKIYRYKNLEDLITNHLSKATPQKKLALIGALDVRMMYDVMVPRYLETTLNYLRETRDVLNSGTSFGPALSLEQIIRKYQDMLDSLAARRGDYMPHMFPESEFRLLWLQGFMKHEIDRIKNEILDARRTGKDPVLAGLDFEKDAQTIHDMAYDRADQEYSKLSHEWSRGSIIPNFLPRQFPNAEGYSKTDPTIHFNYTTKLIEGLKKDVLKADWYLYQQKAREAGERTAIMELTREWYARQINDEELASAVIKTDDVKPGMQVNFNQHSFLIRPGDPSLTMGIGYVSGVVRKITSDEVILDLDTDRIKWEIKRDLENARTVADKLATAGNHRASHRQHIVLQNLLHRGFLTNEDFRDVVISELMMDDAAELVVKGLKRAYDNVESMTRFKLNEIWTTDARGKKLDGYIRRYARAGALESLRTRERELHNLQIMAGRYDGAIPNLQYKLIKGAASVVDWWRKGMKRATSLLYMGMASAFKARVVNQLGATINNLVDAPIYNYERWKRGMEIWDRIKHGKVELMDPDDAKLYKTLVSLGLTEDNSILAIALEAANIKPEDMLIHDAKPAAIKWLVQTWQDAVGYRETEKKLRELREKQLKTADPDAQNEIAMEILAERKIWQAKVEGILSQKNPTEEEKVAAWKKVEELEKKGALTKLNIAQEQGIDLATATAMVGNVAWKAFYTSNLGVGFQAKAEKLRIPAFFIGYTTAIDMGFTEDEAIQFGINSIETRHAFYGTANKQFGANTAMGTVLFQYSQYQYNALSKAIKIMHEAIPQMLRFAHNRPEEVSRIKHLGSLFKHVQTSVDAKGKALKRGEVTLKEVNLLHGIMMKTMWTGVMMQLGTRIFYGITNFQDPVGQTLYKTIDYIITLMQSGFDPGDDDDKERLAWAIQDAALITGLLYKYQLQGLEALTNVDDDGFGKAMADTFYKGRAEDTANFLWRTSNTMHQIGWELGVFDKKLNRKERTYFDMPWLTDQFFTGIKITGWSPADNRPGQYQKRGFFGTRTMDAFTAGRYVETHGKGISGFGEGKSRTRFTYLFDPQSYVPFLDRMITGK